MIKRNIEIEIPDVKRFVEDLNNKSMATVDSDFIYVEGYEIQPHAQYEAPDKFPDCCGFHRQILEHATSWYKDFPNCCERHRKLLLKKWFRKENFDHVPNKIVQAVSYTENFISAHIDDENWFSETTNYIDYIIESFGSPDVGGERYYSNLKHWLKFHCKNVSDLPSQKIRAILNHFESTESSVDTPKFEFNVLEKTFQKWLKMLPNLDSFEILKSRLDNKLPIQVLLHEPKYNKYSGLVKSKVRTNNEFIDFLINATRHQLASINSARSMRTGVSNTIRRKFDIINSQHSITQNELLFEFNREELKYVNVIKKWLKNEKKYLKEIEPVLKEIEEMPKHYEFEERSAFDKEYLKIFFRDTKKLSEAVKFLEPAVSIRKVNITENTTSDLTVYPAKTYSLNEVKEEATTILDTLLFGNPHKIVFKSTNNDSNILGNEVHEQIIDSINTLGKNLEKSDRLSKNMDEEAYRDYFLPFLNSMSESFTATGETFNKNGKTDILIQNTKGENLFLAELKIWKGELELLKALDQLFERYVLWRDTKVSLIFFNKKNSGFTEIIEKALQKVKSYRLFLEYVGKRNETSMIFKMKNPQDNKRELRMEVILFNCYDKGS
ncbi:hypothetical protein [Reichenbachiella agariperforans]|uniref:hypothetical protein n=1 Tax=Reichenbachiella agariperforans TaxID=156994 RepID=UPI001C0810DE|nr:hypothetical protein [Reichenbachiella agariperforans]MBU2913916.1 hypothetical protein [Reichenbachiella agariperforans]